MGTGEKQRGVGTSRPNREGHICPFMSTEELVFYPVGASSGVHVEGPLKGVKHRKDIIRSACLNTSAS